MSGEIDWDDIRALAQAVLERGEPLMLTDEVRALVRRSANEVALGRRETEEALREVSSTTTLLAEIRRRIRDGSNRLMDATLHAYRLRDAGDFEGARKQLEAVLAEEEVPFYREQARRALEDIDARTF
jgi:DUSAM domain-containing protein